MGSAKIKHDRIPKITNSQIAPGKGTLFERWKQALCQLAYILKVHALIRVNK
jgi:hypothetical protein